MTEEEEPMSENEVLRADLRAAHNALAVAYGYIEGRLRVIAQAPEAYIDPLSERLRLTRLRNTMKEREVWND